MATFPTLAAGQKFTAALGDSMLPIHAYKTADEIVSNSTTLQNDDELVLPLATPAKYMLEMFIAYTAGTTADIKVGFTGPSGCDMTYAVRGIGSAVASTVGDINVDIRQIASTTAIGGAGIGTNLGMSLIGFVRNPTTTGNLQFQWSQNSAVVENTTVLADSWMRLIRVV